MPCRMALMWEKRLAPQSQELHQFSVSDLQPDVFYTIINHIQYSKYTNLHCILTVIYLTSSTAAAAKKQKHKSLSSDNVFSALEETEFEHFIEPLRESLEAFRKLNKEKKSSKTNENKIDDASITTTNDENNDEDMNASSIQEQTKSPEPEE